MSAPNQSHVPNPALSPTPTITPTNPQAVALTTAHAQLNHSYLKLYQHSMPRETDSGFPSQFTLQTFGNNLSEQAVSLKHTSEKILVDIATVQSSCDALKIALEDYHAHYKSLQLGSTPRAGAGALGANDTDLDEEQRLLRDILLLQKQFNYGTRTIKAQKERLVLAQSMQDQVVEEQEIGRQQTFG